jgi:hypothetical protein
MFEILYKETFAEIPYEKWNEYKPYKYIIENDLGIEIKYSKHYKNFESYYKKVLTETNKSVIEVLQKKDILKVAFTEKFLEQMSDVTLNLFIMMTKKMAANQINLIYFGKSTRIQFLQIYQALIDCAPRIMSFSQTQRMMLHYVLVSSNVLKDSLKQVRQERVDAGIDDPSVLKDNFVKKRSTRGGTKGGVVNKGTRGRKSTKNGDDLSSDVESDYSNEEKTGLGVYTDSESEEIVEVKPKKKPRGRAAAKAKLLEQQRLAELAKNKELEENGDSKSRKVSKGSK